MTFTNAVLTLMFLTSLVLGYLDLRMEHESLEESIEAKKVQLVGVSAVYLILMIIINA